MKKRIFAAIIAAAICLSFAVFPAMAADSNDTTALFQIGNKTAYVDGSAVTLPEAPAVIGGRTMVPFRALAEALDCSVEWNPQGQFITITNNKDENFKLLYQIGSSAVYRVYPRGEEMYYRMDTTPVLSANGNTLLPARYVAELVGYSANWADTYNAAVIYPAAAVPVYTAKLKVAAILSAIDSNVTPDSFTIDEERFANDTYKHLNEYLIKKGERSLEWSEDLEKMANYRAYERELMGKWITNDDTSYAFSDDRHKLYINICGTHYIPETEVCIGQGVNALSLVQQAKYDEEMWNELKNTDYSQVAVGAIKAGDGYKVLVILSGTGKMK